MKVVIIGGGPAGMMAAISAAKEKNEVVLHNPARFALYPSLEKFDFLFPALPSNHSLLTSELYPDW